jgi:hypothetical protein
VITITYPPCPPGGPLPLQLTSFGTVSDLPAGGTIFGTMTSAVGAVTRVQAVLAKNNTAWTVTFPALPAGVYTLDITTSPSGREAERTGLVLAAAPPPGRMVVGGYTGMVVDQTTSQPLYQAAGMFGLTVSPPTQGESPPGPQS